MHLRRFAALFALEDHGNDGTAVKAIDLGGWKHVVRQQGPSLLDTSRANLIFWTKYFDEIIHPTGAMLSVPEDTVCLLQSAAHETNARYVAAPARTAGSQAQ